MTVGEDAMSTSFSVILLLTINLGLIWLLIAAPVGRRTLHLTRVFHAPPGRIAALVSPLGAEADWHPSVVSSERLAGDRVKQTFSYPDRLGDPITRTFAVSEATDADGIACETRVVEDSALDASFWRNYVERRFLRAVPGGTALTVEQTDRYRGIAFLLFRYIQLRREMKALDRWLTTGKGEVHGVLEHPLTQVGLAVLSTLLLWPFFGLGPRGLLLSTMLTVVIVLHELGHMAAYRAFGHQRVRMIFVPLLGGIAVGGRPYNSHFEVAVCALMGAGMSAFLIPPLVALHDAAGPATSGVLLVFLLILGAFNLLNLLPMHRFDGGQLLRQVCSTRLSLLVVSFLVTLAILWVGWRIGLPLQFLTAGLAVFTVLSLIGAGGVKPRRALDPMTAPQRLLSGFGLYAAIVLHGYAIIYACERLLG
jgi:Zn-dependent protease